MLKCVAFVAFVIEFGRSIFLTFRWQCFVGRQWSVRRVLSCAISNRRAFGPALAIPLAMRLTCVLFAVAEKKGAALLELRPTCENCNRPLPPNSLEARICSYECTFCSDCVDTILGNVCPNCGGGCKIRGTDKGHSSGEAVTRQVLHRHAAC